MRRTGVLVLSAVVVLAIVLGGGGRFAAAQDTDSATHPARGAWIVESDPGDTEYSPRLMILSADGSALFVSGRATTGVGMWEPTGDTSATVTFNLVSNGPAYIVLRASLDIAPDGQSFAGIHTTEIVLDPAGGGTSGEIGPGTLHGTRLAPEAPGTPVASFDDFFPPSEGTPAATPAP